LPLDPFFSGPGLDRADLLRAQPERLRELAAGKDALELVWKDGLPALGENGRLLWQPVNAPDLFLGLSDGQARFSSISQQAHNLKAQFGALTLLSADDAPLFAAALSLAGWHRRHRFCANCGTMSGIVRGGWSRKCAACKADHYRRGVPVVIMLAEHEDRLLLGRQPHYPPGRFSALAGFVEVGETIEAGVARELMEEAGILVGDVRYLGSQPWPFPSSLMIGCTARALGAELTIDTTELDDARWFTRDDVALALACDPSGPCLPPPPFAIASSLLEHWLHA